MFSDMAEASVAVERRDVTVAVVGNSLCLMYFSLARMWAYVLLAAVNYGLIF